MPYDQLLICSGDARPIFIDSKVVNSKLLPPTIYSGIYDPGREWGLSPALVRIPYHSLVLVRGIIKVEAAEEVFIVIIAAVEVEFIVIEAELIVAVN